MEGQFDNDRPSEPKGILPIGLFRSALFQQHKFRVFSDVTSRTILTQFQVRQGQCYWDMFTTNRRCLVNSYLNRFEYFSFQMWMFCPRTYVGCELNLMQFDLVLSVIRDLLGFPTAMTEISHREWTLQACACCIISGSMNKGAVCLYFTEWVLLGLLWVCRVVASDIQSSLLWTFDYSSLDPLSGSCMSEH